MGFKLIFTQSCLCHIVETVINHWLQLRFLTAHVSQQEVIFGDISNGRTNTCRWIIPDEDMIPHLDLKLTLNSPCPAYFLNMCNYTSHQLFGKISQHDRVQEWSIIEHTKAWQLRDHSCVCMIIGMGSAVGLASIHEALFILQECVE